jgi:hypothetical protein
MKNLNMKRVGRLQRPRAKNFAPPVAASATMDHHHWNHRPLHLASPVLKK